MTELPERIWACMGGPMVGMFVSGGNNGGWPEYVRADAIEALTAERDLLRALLAEADRRIVWEAHGFGSDFAERVEAALKGESHE